MINTARKFLLTLCAVALALPFAGASERAETLRAINWVENPTNHTRPGSRGELGPYQFLPQTWRLHTRTPFRQAVVREQADAVAVRHYEWIADGLREAGIDPNPFNIALAWNCGLGAVRSGRVPAVSYAYAERVQNLVESQRAHQQAALAASIPEVAAKPALPDATDEGAPLFVFNPSRNAAPKFVVSLGEQLYEQPIPVIFTEKTPRASDLAQARSDESSTPTLQVEGKPMFTLGSVAAPRFALIH
ncbi:MAG: hypothetical protein KF715_05725 [Candidatus Didemnitutus sp.]|nr:hypothetical protein [Candidatus Didemnitutus sp.]